MSRKFDAIILGAGQAGPPLAGRLTAAGQTVALVERHLFGGTCVNTGCIPTKTMVASAYAAQQARRGAEFGVKISGEIGFDLKVAKARKEAVLMKSRTGVEKSLREMKGCTVFDGQARFVSANEVQVGEEVLTAEKIFINVGGRASVPKMPGVEDVPFLNNVSMLELEVVPEHLVVVGGSYIGLEFAQMFRRFGATVTVVERGPRLVAHEDEEISAAIQGILEAEGIVVRTNANCIAFSKRDAGVAVHVTCDAGDAEPEVVGSHVLLAIGRKPNTDDLGLEAAGVMMNERGFIVVDDTLRTNVDGIYALGDCNGRGAFTHTSYNDFEIVAANLLDGEKRRVSDRIQCHALYIDPPLGQVGMTEAEVRKTGRKILVGTRPMTKVGRAVEKGESQGLMKVFVDAESELILGAAILGVGGDEAIHCILDTMYAKKSYKMLTHAVHIHPTVSELIPTMLEGLKPLE